MAIHKNSIYAKQCIEYKAESYSMDSKIHGQDRYTAEDMHCHKDHAPENKP